MLIPLMSEVQMSVDFKPKFNAFFVAGSRFYEFFDLYPAWHPFDLWKRFRDGNASWTLGSGIGIPYWLTVPCSDHNWICFLYTCRLRAQRLSRRPSRKLLNPPTRTSHCPDEPWPHAAIAHAIFSDPGRTT